MGPVQQEFSWVCLLICRNVEIIGIFFKLFLNHKCCSERRRVKKRNVITDVTVLFHPSVLNDLRGHSCTDVLSLWAALECTMTSLSASKPRHRQQSNKDPQHRFDYIIVFGTNICHCGGLPNEIFLPKMGNKSKFDALQTLTTTFQQIHTSFRNCVLYKQGVLYISDSVADRKFSGVDAWTQQHQKATLSHSEKSRSSLCIFLVFPTCSLNLSRRIIQF